MIRVNPRADGLVRIPLSSGYEVTVDALRDIEHAHLASAAELTLDQFESEIRRWSMGEGMPYHVIIP